MSIRFGTSGWRAIISDEFTFTNVKRITLAVAEYFKKHRLTNRSVIIGYDTRFLSKEFAQLSAETLSSQKIKVYLSDRDVPTPTISFHIIDKKCAGGINITASHNPSDYNGIKFSPSYGGPASTEVTDEIEKLANKITLKEIKNLSSPEVKFIKTFDAKSKYKRRLRELINLKAIRKAKLKVGIDCMHGTSYGYLDSILKEARIKTVVLNNYLNPLFGGMKPEPAKENLSKLINLIKREKLNLGLATDGDADRFGIVDPSGEYICANWVGSLIFYHLLHTRPRLKKVARTVATTSLIDKIARKYNIEVVETPVGFKYIGEVLYKGDCILAIEESGGLSIAGYIPEKDGILACLLMAEMVAMHKKSPKEILRAIFKEIGVESYTDRINVELKPEIKKRLLKKLQLKAPSSFAGKKVIKTIRIDGYKFILEDGSWIMFRSSGTEPVVRCYMESATKKDLSDLTLAAKETIDCAK